MDPPDFFENKKMARNPLVPLGALATAGVLIAGLVSFKQGNAGRSQALMRARVIFQGATVALMTGTIFFHQKSEEGNSEKLPK